VNVGDPISSSQNEKYQPTSLTNEEVEMTDGKSERSYYLRCGVMSAEGRTSGRNQLSRRNVMSTTETQDITETKLRKIALISSGDPHKQFHSLMHHYNLASLKKCFKELGRNKSPGIDGIKKEDYEKNVDAKLQSLLARMKSMSYRPAPVRQVFIPKEGSRIEKRPLGINNFEDKIFMKMTQNLQDIYYKMLRGTNTYSHEKNQGYMPLTDVIEFKEGKPKALNFDYINVCLLETLFGAVLKKPPR